jgi:hypothetical protein
MKSTFIRSQGAPNEHRRSCDYARRQMAVFYDGRGKSIFRGIFEHCGQGNRLARHFIVAAAIPPQALDLRGAAKASTWHC